MHSLELLKIDLKGLQDEAAAFECDLDDAFFQSLDDAEVKQGSLHVSGSIRKASGFFELQLHTAGYVTVTCDRCLDPMEQPVENEGRFEVRLGHASSEDGEAIVVDEEEGILDTAWLVYELAVLAIPIQHVHAPGKCNPAMTQVLEELSADRSGDAESNQPVDPRWEKLKSLKV